MFTKIENRVLSCEEVTKEATCDNSANEYDIEAANIIKIMGGTSAFIVDLKLLDKVYQLGKGNYKSHYFGLLGVFIAGYVYGIRAERRRRKKASSRQVQ